MNYVDSTECVRFPGFGFAGRLRHEFPSQILMDITEVCNLACTHCLVSSSPTNRTHEHLSLERVRPYLDEALGLGIKEYYFQT